MEGLFEYYIENENLHFKYAKGEPAVKDREFHHYHEFVLFLGGNAYFISKNIQQELSYGSIVLIPKEQFHQFVVDNPAKYCRCILGFRETPEIAGLIREIMDEVKIICMPSKQITALFDELMQIVKTELPDEIKCLFIRASLTQLLVHLKQYAPAQITHNINISQAVRQAMAYIDEHYSEKISVESIAGQLYISPSTLAHKFRKELNITVYQYISKRRMLSVYKHVEEGASYADAAIKSGFRDYSCYYRLRKKYGRQKSTER